MVQVKLRVRGKPGYDRSGQIKPITLDSSERLEVLLNRSSALGNTAASSHSALYFNGVELPLNTSIASHNFRDGAIIEGCSSPLFSSALSAIMYDYKDVQKLKITRSTYSNSECKKAVLSIMDFPPEIRNVDEENSFWSTDKWTFDRIKNRIVCLATIKKVLQRDDRFACYRPTHITTIEELHEFMQDVWKSEQRKTEEKNNRALTGRLTQSGNMFQPTTKANGGRPATNWMLMQQALAKQTQVAATLDIDSDIDTNEQFIINEENRRASRNINNNGSTQGTTSAGGSRGRRATGSRAQRTNQATARSNPQGASSNSSSPTQNDSSRSQSTTRRGNSSSSRKSKEYCPEFSSGPFSILIALKECMDGIHNNGNRELSLTEDRLKKLAQPICRANFYDRMQGRGSRNAFACMEKLAEKNFVRKELLYVAAAARVDDNEQMEKWALLPAGEKLASDCIAFQSVFNGIIPKHPHPIPRHNDRTLTMLVDLREDSEYIKRIEYNCHEANRNMDKRDLPAGDYLFVKAAAAADENEEVIPLVIERKSWSDFADSVMNKGKKRNRLDCVKIGSDPSQTCCPAQKCQLCKMKRSGCSQVMFLIEGARCKGIGTKGVKCTEQTPCHVCKTLVERHGVIQEQLERILHRIQLTHGCFVQFTRSYNETISCLFTIGDFLERGKSFSTCVDTSTKLSYNNFCSNAKGTQAPIADLCRKREHVLDWSAEMMASVLSSNNDSDLWQSDFCNLISSDARQVSRHMRGDSSISSGGSRSNKRKVNGSDCLEKEPPRKKKHSSETSGELHEAICLDDFEDDTVDDADMNLNQSQESVQFVGVGSEGKNHDNDEKNSNYNSEDGDDDVDMNLNQSQDSVIFEGVSEGINNEDITQIRGGGDDDSIVFIDEPESQESVICVDMYNGLKPSRCDRDSDLESVHTQPPSGTQTEFNFTNCNISADNFLTSSPLIIVREWDEYDKKYYKGINKIWSDASAKFGYATVQDEDSNNNIEKLRVNARAQMTELIRHGPMPYARRESLLQASLWIQLILGIQIRTTVRQDFADEISSLWSGKDSDAMQTLVGYSATENNFSDCLNNSIATQNTSSTYAAAVPPLSPEIQIENPEDLSNSDLPSPTRTDQEARIRTGGFSSDNSLANKSSSSQQMASLREARLRRFDSINSTSTVNNSGRNESNTEPDRVESMDQWTCKNCTLINEATEIKCIACGETPKLSSVIPVPPITAHASNKTQRSAKNTEPDRVKSMDQWTCKNCTLINEATEVKCIACGETPKLSSAIPELPITTCTPCTSTAATNPHQSKPNEAIWKCERCTYDNSADARSCEKCTTTNPFFLTGPDITKSSDEWLCVCEYVNCANAMKCVFCKEPKPCTTENQFIPDPVNSSSGAIFSSNESFSTSYQASSMRTTASVPDQTLSSTSIPRQNNVSDQPKKKKPRCRACGLEGHNRGTATEINCPAYFNTEEVELRANKKRQQEEKARAAIAAYDAIKNATENAERERERARLEEERRAAERQRLEDQLKVFQTEQLKDRERKAKAAQRKLDRMNRR